ncbi:MAG: hypothetical protein A2741_01460 [Candidatus Zambryskibacteria bacterium RIFCSPHIGHO2_01_FULL_43_27]|uniref:Extracellular solute-binding protein family 1 n=1 Tax=Candidatus Zambryskibacteria bacterium RIFCSPLOWO2_01_FULL_43_17 TaxID=1802760 RepID=A0A1G2U313_9BACT|nr:MAG: hypothetical protein A2741_01460 [Candidatus Zambryskibacteria bacterium RIFCSPHIGHO2_01_FULL_43_27]OHA99445.1 MAG: hypothetical protein A3E93_02570 [Candidatus Zambryskibacteria bacterium RIFCSPHIGHO2_12_FULL_43_12b]OHB03280.1 MAG: hypothetical protein A2920_00190 [Candidatus Zambryskibacteria bacterium RIFCSPLOWO2_01_FULL_43_17]
MSKFQIILTGIFAVFILAGVFVFAFFGRENSVKSTVLVWGPLPESSFNAIIAKLPIWDDKNISIKYVNKKAVDFDRDFVEALASGTGPDVVIISQDNLLRHRNKLFLVPFESYSERGYKDNFIEEGEIFLEPTGIIAIPFLVDPLMMYWNRDIFTASSVAQPPKYWDEFYELSKTLTKRDNSFNVSKATLPLGEYSNVTNAKDILATLIFQAGNTEIVKSENNRYIVTLTKSFGANVNPATAAVNFYTEFSNPAKAHYSWNRSLPPSQTLFTSGDLAVYFGFASELPLLKLKNPNLNFDTALLPQSRTGDRPATFGRMHGLAVTKSTRSLNGAFTVVSALSSPQAIDAFAKSAGLPPVRRDLISKGISEANQTLFYQSALWAKGWLDPNAEATNSIFEELVESITSGRARSEQAISLAEQEISALLPQ